MYHVVYLTQNLVNGKIYVGKRSTWDLNDGYLGSGFLLNKAIKKHGKENFKRIIIHFCHSEQHAYEMEEMIVDKWFIAREDTYNISLGGNGHKSEQNNVNFGGVITKSESVRKKISDKLKGRTSPQKQFFRLIAPAGDCFIIDNLHDWCNHLKLSPKHLKINLGKVVPEIDIPIRMTKKDNIIRLSRTTGWKLEITEEKTISHKPDIVIEQITVRNNVYTLQDPDGNTYLVYDLPSFCSEHYLSPKHLKQYLGSVVPQLPVPKGLHKKDTIRRLQTTPGWIMRKGKSVFISTLPRS